jgi:actin related protein 2/3 complex subunit 2
MILLETSNRIIEEQIRRRLGSRPKRDAVDMTLADFDGVLFHLTTNPQQRNMMTVSIQWRVINEFMKHGARERLQQVYGSMVASPESGYDASVTFNLDSCTADTATKVAALKNHLFSCPFEASFNAVQGQGNAPPCITLQYRDNEAMYIKQEGDRVIVIFSINFKDPDDIVYSKVFLQEFADARRTLSGAPSVMFTQGEAPGELRGVSGVYEGQDQGYVSFVLFGNHIAKAGSDRRCKTIDNIQLFRDYLHYHIKCSKAYMHTRMRNRVESLLKVLNRAKMSLPKEKKTASGRTFKRGGR